MTLRHAFSTILIAMLLTSIALFGIGKHVFSNSTLSSQSVRLPDQIRVVCERDQWHEVQMNGETATFDVPLSNDDRYVIVVNSLGNPLATNQVQLNAQSRSTIDISPLVKLRSLNTPSKQRLIHISRKVIAPAELAVNHSAKLKQPAETKTFYLHTTDGPLDNPHHYTQISAEQIAVGKQVAVFLDSQLNKTDLAAGLVDEIVHLMDSQVVPKTEELLGRFSDVDGDGKLTLLLSPWLARLQGGETSVGGFVRAEDFRSDRKPPFSNQCDMLYLNSQLKPDKNLATLLTHEYTHAVCVSQRLNSASNSTTTFYEEDWLNEAIAHVSEQLQTGSWSNLDHRLSCYLNSPANYPLVVDDYYQAGLWRNHGCRGATFLFLRWCVDRFGPEILRNLATSHCSGIGNIEQATNNAFADLFRHWSLAVANATHNNSTEIDGRSSVSSYSSIDLISQISNWNLAGPSQQTLTADETAIDFSLRGTSSQIFELLPNPESTQQSCRVTLKAQPGARVQVSVLRLPGKKQHWELNASLHGIAHYKVQADDGQAETPNANIAEHRLSVSLEEPAGWVTQRISWEYHSVSGHKSRCFLTTDFPTTAERMTLPIPRLPDSVTQLTVKAVAEDAHGNRISSRQVVPVLQPNDDAGNIATRIRKPGDGQFRLSKANKSSRRY